MTTADVNNLSNLPLKLDLEGANKFRDLGGYPAAPGLRIRYGRVFRSDQLGNLTDADQALLADIGLRTVVDFRRGSEREDILDRIDDPDVKQLWLPVEEKGADVKGLRLMLEQGELDAAGAHQYLVHANEHFIRRFSEVFRSYLELLLDEANYPIAFHCAAGKDRAGFAAALTLMVAGASEETIMYDYLATNHCTANWVNGILEGLSDTLNMDTEALRTLMQVQPDFLQKALDTIGEDYGNVPAYLEQALNFGPEKQVRVRDLLCEPDDRL